MDFPVATNACNTLVVTPVLAAKWLRTDGAEDVYAIEGQELPATLERFVEDGEVHLALDLFGCDAETMAAVQVKSLVVRDLQQKTDFEERPDEPTGPVSVLTEQPAFDSDGHAVVKLAAEALLGQLSSGVNRNVLAVKITLDVCGTEVVASATNLLHVISQQMILFIPGVCGSQITVSGHPDEQAFPEWSVAGVKEFGWLKTDRDGDPSEGADALELELFRTFSPKTIYAVEDQAAVASPEGHPRVARVGADKQKTPVEHYYVEPWPYDWRLRLEYAVDALMGRPATGRNTGERSAPIRDIVTEHRQTRPFLADKVHVACHSTGGLILRSLLMQAGVEELVDRAFFVDVPFWGAPKAYYVYLTGKMLEIVSDDLMLQLAPNMPIVYYLAPTERYPDDVLIPTAEGFEKRVKREPGQSVGRWMKLMITLARDKGDYPKQGAIDDWNPALEQAAAAFHAPLDGEPLIGWDRCTVFWSERDSDETPGATWVNPKREAFSNVHHETVEGDGTVPTVSQKADFPESCLVEIAAKPLHVPAPNEAQVWETIVEKLAARAAG